nr:carbon starvation CstA family protein [Halorientalis sp. IM1011]
MPVILIYAALASGLPVWILLQPRDYSRRSCCTRASAGRCWRSSSARSSARRRSRSSSPTASSRSRASSASTRCRRTHCSAAVRHYRLWHYQRVPLAGVLGDDGETVEQGERRTPDRVRRYAR